MFCEGDLKVKFTVEEMPVNSGQIFMFCIILDYHHKTCPLLLILLLLVVSQAVIIQVIYFES